MKKLFLMGRSEAGKTSLTQALKGEELHYVKTQYTTTDDNTIDSPGEMQNPNVLVLVLHVSLLKRMWLLLYRQLTNRSTYSAQVYVHLS